MVDMNRESQDTRVLASELFAKPLSARERRELERAAATPDSAIDYSDAPEVKVPPQQELVVGRFYKPR
jgi:hypothetical protein